MSDVRHLTHHDHRCVYFLDDSEALPSSSVLLMALRLIGRHGAVAAAQFRAPAIMAGGSECSAACLRALSADRDGSGASRADKQSEVDC